MDRLVSIRKLENLLGFDRSHLREVARRAPRLYEQFDIKVGGKWRHIDRPKSALEKIQKSIKTNVLEKFPFEETFQGSVRGGSPLKNAKIHTPAAEIVSIDLKDFFPNTNYREVYRVFVRHLRCAPNIARLLTQLTTVNGRLPQGTATSPYLANLTLLDLHEDLAKLSISAGCQLSFYVDDITITGPTARSLLCGALSIISKHGLLINRSKTKATGGRKPRVVTGINADRRSPSVPLSYRKKVREEIVRLSTHPSISVNELKSVNGKIRHVQSINSAQGAALARMFDAWLDDVVPTESGDRLKKPSRKCKSFARHRRRKPIRTPFVHTRSESTITP